MAWNIHGQDARSGQEVRVVLEGTREEAEKWASAKGVLIAQVEAAGETTERNSLLPWGLAAAALGLAILAVGWTLWQHGTLGRQAQAQQEQLTKIHNLEEQLAAAPEREKIVIASRDQKTTLPPPGDTFTPPSRPQNDTILPTLPPSSPPSPPPSKPTTPEGTGSTPTVASANLIKEPTKGSGGTGKETSGELFPNVKPVGGTAKGGTPARGNEATTKIAAKPFRYMNVAYEPLGAKVQFTGEVTNQTTKYYAKVKYLITFYDAKQKALGSGVFTVENLPPGMVKSFKGTTGAAGAEQITKYSIVVQEMQ